MSETPFNPKGMYFLQHTTRTVRAFVSQLNYVIDVDTMHRREESTLQLNDIGRVQLTTTKPLFYDRYDLNRATGSFILIDPATNNTVAAGMIRGRSRQVSDLTEGDATEARPQSTNVVWEAGTLSMEQREALTGHKGAILWFTGLSGSGKSTIAKKLEEALYETGVHTMFLDGDNLRHGLNGDLGFSAADRQENIRRVSEVAKLGLTHGNIVLCSFISPFARDREFARSLAPNDRFFEIFVKVDIEVAKRRDPKGLYAKALSGEIKEFTGISSPYEEPQRPELVVETDINSVDEIVGEIVEMLELGGIIKNAKS